MRGSRGNHTRPCCRRRPERRLNDQPALVRPDVLLEPVEKRVDAVEHVGARKVRRRHLGDEDLRGFPTPRAGERTSAPYANMCSHMARATILHADLDSFYASVEQRDDPRLRGRPVIVGGGVVLAASYEAKACGVRTAMGERQARRCCPDAIVVPPRMLAYAEASKAVYQVFEDTTPLVEGLSIDEAFLDVRGLERLAGSPAEIAARLRVEVRGRVGLPITVGVARTKFLAKVASGVAKPDGLLVVPPDDELGFLHPL